MVILPVLVVLIGCSLAENTPSLIGVLTAQDRGRLRNVFQNAQIDSLETAFYVSRGLATLGETDDVKKKACSFISKHRPLETSLEDIFYATSVDSALNCEPSFNNFESSLKESLSSDRNTSELFHIVSSLANIGSPVGEKLLSPAKIAEIADVEETVLSYSRAFLTGAQLSDGDLSPLVDLIEDVSAQADETPTALYFEGGLETTASVVTGIFGLSAKAGKRPTLSALQATLFGSYFMSIRFTESVREAYHLVTASRALANNEFIVPAGLTQVSRRPLSSKNNNFEVQLTNIFGSPVVGKSSVTLSSVKGPSGSERTINKNFVVAEDGITYSYQLFSELNEPGTYTVTLNTQTEDKAVVPSLINVQFLVTVSFPVTISSAEISILEKDQNVAVKTSSIEYPGTSKEKFSADHHSKVRMTFQLLNKETKQKVTVHQTFVRLVANEGEDIYFVATPSTDGIYTFELDVADSAKESFGSKSGAYSMSLIVGGASVANPFSWDIGSLTLKFPEVPQEEVSEETKYRYKPKPTIEHMFTPPEKRPPAAISMLFSVLVIVPLVILLPIWLLLGANLSKIGLAGPWTLIFHFGLAGIFLLYYCFWIKLNMFQTLKYLALLGALTFIGGNRMLRRIAKH